MASPVSDLRAFSSTVDWWKPPPRIFQSNECITIPRELVRGVAASVFDDAVALLRNKDAVELTREEARRLAPNRDPNQLIEVLIEQKKKDLRFLSEHPAESFPGPKAELKEAKASEQRRTKKLNSEIKQFEQWKHLLKPYLIKAVTLQGIEGFVADFCGDDLLVEQMSLGGAPLPMKRMPVVAFLPKKPQRIYTSVSMME